MVSYNRKTRFIALAAISTTALFSLQAQAQDDWRNWATGDRLSFELSAFNIHSDAKIGVKDAFLGGVNVDLEDLLGIDDNEVVPHVNAMWRMAERHTLRYQHFSQSQDQSDDIKLLDFDITTARTELDLQADTIAYTYSVLFDENRDFYLGAGISNFDLEITLSDSEEILDEYKLDESLPIPALIVGYDWAITDRWVWRNSLSALALSLSLEDGVDYEGHVYTISTAIEWRILEHLSLTAGYEFSDLDVEAQEDGEDYKIVYKDQMHGPRIGLKARF
ncbi:MAG: hypothetical protein V7746_04250 [Halioglobus sp.]